MSRPCSCPDMVPIWEPANKFRIWYLIEAHATQAQADLGVVPQSAAAAIWKVRAQMEARDIDVPAIDAIEAEVKHDVIAFLTYLADLVGEESRFVAAFCLRTPSKGRAGDCFLA